MTAPAGNPLLNPTTRRVGLARAIDAGNIRHWPHRKPLTKNIRTDRTVTDDVDRFVSAGLAEYLPHEYGCSWQRVALTDTGRAWLAAAEKERAT